MVCLAQRIPGLFRAIANAARYVRNNPFRSAVIASDAIGVLANSGRLIVDVTDAFGLDDNDKKLLTFLTDKGNMIDAKRAEVLNCEIYIDNMSAANQKFKTFSFEIQKLLMQIDKSTKEIINLSEKIQQKKLPPYLKTYEEPKIHTEEERKQIQKINDEYKEQLSPWTVTGESLWLALSIGGTIWNFKTVRGYEHFVNYRNDVRGARILNFLGSIGNGMLQTVVPIMNLLSAYIFYMDCKTKFDNREQVRNRMKEMKEKLDKYESQLIILINGYDPKRDKEESLEHCYILMKEAVKRDLTETDKDIVKKGLIQQKQEIHKDINDQIVSTGQLVITMGAYAKSTQNFYKSQKTGEEYEKDRKNLEAIGEEINRYKNEYEMTKSDEKGEKASKIISDMVDRCDGVIEIVTKWSKQIDNVSKDLLVIGLIDNAVQEIEEDRNENNDLEITKEITKSAKRTAKQVKLLVVPKEVADRWTEEEIEKRIKEKLNEGKGN